MATCDRIVFGFAALLAASNCLAASVPALTFNDPNNFALYEPTTDQTWGWSFHVVSPAKVTHLAWRDEGQDGLSHSHRIGIWAFAGAFGPQGLGTLVADKTVPSGAAAELAGTWRRVALNSPPTLAAGWYIIGGQQRVASTDRTLYRSFFVTYDPRVDYSEAMFSTANGFNVPNASFIVGNDGEFGPMFFLEAIPEPTSAILFGAAIIGLRRRRGRN